MRVVVTATNAAGSRQAASEPTASVTAAPPVNTSAPTISGTAEDGETLSADPGTWSGTPAIGFDYQWRRCNAAGAGCADIAGATAQTYTAGPADVDATLRVVVSASNGGGSASATSAATGAVDPAPPVNTVLPTIAGTVQDGETLTAGNGEWTGSPTLAFTYQWRRCAPGGLGCADIAGATGQTYTATGADVGSALRVVVTASNAAGSATATSAPTGTAAAAAPTVTTAPVVTGTASDGETLSASTGDWDGTAPIGFAYAWQRCDTAGANCAPIAGATASTYDLTPADVGSRMRVVVTATNAAGSRSAASDPTTTVAAAPPANTAAPTIAGTPEDGETLTAEPGTWSGTGPITFGYQWRRCDGAGANCADIAGASAQTYTAGAADVGATLRVEVTASNDGGSADATSGPTAAVAATAPVGTAAPEITGIARDGETLTASPGTWTGTEPITYSYAWQRCDAAGASCDPIAGATGETYTAGAADVGSRLRVEVTATNAAGPETSASAATGVVAPAPTANAERPSISGTAQVGETLTADPGEWTGTGPITFVYAWQRCEADGSGCTAIAGADGQTYTAVAADQGRTLRVVVTPTNAAGTGAPATSEPSATIAAPALPANTAPPSITGTTTVGETLTAEPGTWTENPTSYTYAWERCDAAGANCTDIAGANGSTYTPIDADIGTTLRVEVTASNALGASTPQRSEPSGVIQATGVAGAPQTPVTPGTSAPSTGGDTQPVQPGATATDLAGLAGSQVAPARCATLVGGGGFRRVNAATAGAVRMRVRADGAIVPAAPLVVTVTADRPAGLRSVRYTLDGRAVRAASGPSHRLALTPARLNAGRHVLRARLTLAGGRTRTISRTLRVAACAARFTAVQYRTTAGTGIRVRVDTSTAARTMTFSLPAAVARGLGRGTPAGRIRVVTPTLRRQFTFHPATATQPTRLPAAAGRPAVRVSGRTITVTGLPASTGIVELTVYQQRAPRGSALLGAGRRVRATATVRTTRTLRLQATMRGRGGR